MNSEKHYAVAIDGPSGAGKSSVAKAAAKRLGAVYVDTGAIYRTIGLAAKRAGILPEDAQRLAGLLPRLSIELTYDAQGAQRMLLNGEDVSDDIRTPEISRSASAVSAVPAVRAFLLEMQREAARTRCVLMDGRDIGTVVLPQAEVKIFLTASPEARAKRRFKELREKGDGSSYETVLAELQQRDAQDMNRAIAPLRQAEDAVLVDTSELDFDGSVDAVCAVIREKLEQ